MCLIIAHDPIRSIAPVHIDVIEEAIISNPDGCGIAYAQHGRLHIIKTLQPDVETQHDLLSRLYFDSVPFVWHVRYATHGSPSIQNCHPFQVRDVAIAHNGILSGYGYKDKSDTRDFIDRNLRRLPSSVLMSDATIRKIESMPSMRGSKLALIHADGRLQLANSRLGSWCTESGHWFSVPWFADYDPYEPVIPDRGLASHMPARYSPSRDWDEFDDMTDEELQEYCRRLSDVRL